MVKYTFLNFIIKKGRVLFFSFVLLGLSFVLAYADIDYTYSIYQVISSNSIGMPALVSDTGNIYSRVQNIYSDIHQYLPSINTISTTLTNFYSRNHTDLQNIEVDTSALRTTSTTISSKVSNILSGLSATLPDLKNDVHQLQEVLANSTDAAIRHDQAARVDQLNNDFLSSSGSASVSLDDLGSASDSVSALKGSLSGGVSASSLWTVLGFGSDSWGWFSQATASDLDSSGGLMSDSEYTYLDAYYAELGLYLGGDYYD